MRGNKNEETDLSSRVENPSVFIQPPTWTQGRKPQQ